MSCVLELCAFTEGDLLNIDMVFGHELCACREGDKLTIEYELWTEVVHIERGTNLPWTMSCGQEL